MLGLPVITFVSKAKKMWEKHPSHPIKRYPELKVWYTKHHLPIKLNMSDTR